MSAPTLFYDIDMDDNNKCWFVHAFYPILLSYDLNTKQSNMEKILPFCGNGKAAYGPIKKCGGKIYIAPRCSDKLLIYDIESKNLQTIAINIEPIKGEGLFNLFTSICVYENTVFLFPGRFPAIVKYNILSGELVYIDDWYTDNKELWNNKKLVIFGNSTVKGKEVYLPCWQKAEYCVFSVVDESMKFCETKYSSGMSSITFMGEELLCSFKGTDNICNISLDKEIVYDSGGSSGISGITALGDALFVFPMKAQNISMYCKSNNSWKVIETIKEDFTHVGKQYQIFDWNFFSVKKIGEYVFLSSKYDGQLSIVDLKNQKVDKYKIVLSKQDKKVIFNTIFHEIRYENDEIELQDYVESIIEI